MAKATQMISYHHSGVEPTNVTDLKSYATIDRLNKALQEAGIAQDRHLIVKTMDDRYTAIFNQSNIQDGNVMRYAWLGYMTVG